MAAIEIRGEPPVPTLLSVGLPVHVVLRMANETRADVLVRQTPLTERDLAAVNEYYREHTASIDWLLAEEAAVAAALVERLETDAQLQTRVRSWQSEPTIPLEDLDDR
jgi:hypothetical protein